MDDAPDKLYDEMWGKEIELPDPDDFFETTETMDGEVKRGKFVAKRLADWFLKNFHIKTMGVHGMIYIYKNGVYQTCAEEFIHNTATKILDEATISRRISEVVFLVKTQTYSDREDPPAWLVNTRSGFVNVLTGNTKPHDPKIFSTSQIPVYLRPDSDCPKVKEFISQIVKEDDVPVVQEIFGFALLGDYRIQKAVMFIGDGSNGKSTLMELIRKFLGRNNTSSIALQDLTTNKFARNQIYGKMANLFADLPDMALQNTGFFKMMTGGDSMFADIKFKEGFDFFNKAKLIFSCNKLPVAYDETDAFFRRWVFLTFPNKFEGENAKQNILEEITTDEEMSGLLNWALKGLMRLLKNKNFTNSKKTEEIRDYYERMSSPIAAFLNAEVTEDPKSRVTKQELYKVFCTFCNLNKLPIVSDNVFGRRLIQTYGHKITDGQETIDGKRTRVWKGIRMHGLHGMHGLSSIRDVFHDKVKKEYYIGDGVHPVQGVQIILNFIPTDGINYVDLLNLVRRDLQRAGGTIDDLEFERLVDKLSEEGRIYEDTPGHIRKT